MKTICGLEAEASQHAADSLGWESSSTDWRAVVADPEIDLIDVCTPSDAHAEICIAAAKAGKAVLCEKPLANTLEQAESMVHAAQSAGVPNGIIQNYRKVPAVALAKRMIEEGRLGTIYHFRANYLQDWLIDPNFPLLWRLQKDKAGSGVHGDLNAHTIDLARHLVGEIAEVSGCLQTFIHERPLPEDPAHKGPVTVDDAALFLARFRSGAVGSFEASRMAIGRHNANRFEINGSRGSLAFNLERLNELEFFSGDDPKEVQGFRTINVTDGSHPYASRYWPAGHTLGWEHTFVNLIADTLLAIAEGRDLSPSFADGLANQRILDAVERSSNAKTWLEV